jgi:N-hydroxyarylamine O-acetyltransferase
MFLRVLLEGVDWITDVGVGGASLTAAIRFEPDVEQETPHETRRIVRDPGRFFHQARFGSEWVDVYEFTGELMPAIDREVANWFTSAHPDSHFKNRLIVARAGEGGRRYTLLDGEFKVRERNGHASARPLDADELVRVLADDFGLTFAPGTRFSIAPSA